jgi:hypothetical protein
LADSSEFNLDQIITDSLIITRKNSPEAYDYMVSLSEEKLVSKMTASQAKEIARELLTKLGLVNFK